MKIICKSGKIVCKCGNEMEFMTTNDISGEGEYIKGGSEGEYIKVVTNEFDFYKEHEQVWAICKKCKNDICMFIK